MKNKETTREDYLKRLNIVYEYINNHLDEDMNLNKFAEISNFSPFHFHRIFKAFQHETISAYITRIRIETAAKLLRYSDLPIEKIASNVGYAMPTSLTKAFKSFYGITPSEYRENKNFIITYIKPPIHIELKKPSIEKRNLKQAIYIRTVSSYDIIDYNEIWGKLFSFAKDQKLFSFGMEALGVYLDDPKVTVADKLRSEICLVITKPIKAQGEIGIKQIQGGRYLVFSYKGSYDSLGAVYDTIFGKYIPETNYKLRNVPAFEKYINNPKTTEPDRLKTKIYIPIE